MKLKAYCDSIPCTGGNYRKVLKEVKEKTINCPNCKAALLWKSDKKKQVNKKPKQKKEKDYTADFL